MSNQTFSIQSRIKSFGFAWRGLRAVFAGDHNLLVHLAATIGVGIAAIYFRTTASEAIALVIAVGIVWVAELFNTAIEKAMDLVSEDYHPRIKFVKDVSAAAVLISALMAVVIGLIVFIPKIIT